MTIVHYFLVWLPANLFRNPLAVGYFWILQFLFVKLFWYHISFMKFTGSKYAKRLLFYLQRELALFFNESKNNMHFFKFSKYCFLLKIRAILLLSALKLLPAVMKRVTTLPMTLLYFWLVTDFSIKISAAWFRILLNKL